MKNFLYSVAHDLKQLADAIEKLKSTPGSSRSRGELVIKSNEYSRLIQLMREALSYYKYFGKEDDIDYVRFSSLVRKSDDRAIDFILNEESVIIQHEDEDEYVTSEDEEDNQFVDEK
jgi:hypothetical protein